MQDYELISKQRCQQSRPSESGRGRTGTDGKNGWRRHLPSPVVVAICKCVRLLPPSMRLYELEYPIPPAIPIRSKSRYYRRKFEHAPTAAYLKRPGQREEEDQCWWAGSQRRLANTSSATASGGMVSSGSSERRSDRERIRKQDGVGMCRYQDYFC